MANPKKKIMRALKINEISGVDVPAQEGALSVIMKRATPEDENFEKMSALTSPDAGHSHLIALNGSPDGVELNSGFTSYEEGHTHPWVRGAGGEIVIGTARSPDGGDPHIHRIAFMSKADGDELSEEFTEAEDDDEEDEEIDALIDTMKRKFTAEQRKEMATNGLAMSDGAFPIANKGDLSNAIQAFGRAKNKAGAARHIKARAKALNATDLLPDEGLLSVKKNEPADVAGTTVGEENPMTDKNKKAAEPTVADLQAQLAKSNAMAALTDIEKAHYATLKGDDAEAFLNMDADARGDIMKGIAKDAADSDPIEYTTMDGIELRKSAGPALITMAKSNDALRKRLDASEGARVQDTLEKRAVDELPNMPGSVAERAALLKAVDAIEDEGSRKASMAALKASNDAMGAAFVQSGHTGQPAVIHGSPAAELEELSKAHQVANPELTIQQASNEVLKTAKGQELYAKSIN